MSQFTDKTVAENQVYPLKAGDRYPVLTLELFDADGAVHDLTGVNRSFGTINGSPNLTVLDTTGIEVGQKIVATGIPTGTTVQSITPNVQVVMSANATATATVNVEFVPLVKLVVAPVVGGRRLVNLGAMDRVGLGPAGTVSYTWAGTELVEGDYLMEVIVNYGLSTQESFPRGGYYKLTIVPHL